MGFDETGAVPVALLHHDLVAQRTDELVAHRGWKAAELDRRAVRAERVDPNRLFVRVDAGETVEVGQPLLIIVGILDALDRLADFVAGELEGTRAQDILLVPAGILVEYRLLVDKAERVGE